MIHIVLCKLKDCFTRLPLWQLMSVRLVKKFCAFLKYDIHHLVNLRYVYQNLLMLKDVVTFSVGQMSLIL
jgi:hypothetical protein